ncbi:ATP-binding protein [Paenibacillus sp. N1-5-1-14]|uniref:ATP-binding protein n=1 Tax=Paenibacillus radicibacter TaxID=2972488 RepID=UPI002158E3E7|nr:ATP-binding protein [Paenibacillus radicibacter]MCR8644717.1 ATP-binding protein [Paenibacillus radicibacter]
MANFRTRARAVDLLGKQQIRDEVTAISELLRNSYDADADEGLVDVDTRKERIIIFDDGDGMSKNDILNNWLTLGTYSKKNKVITQTKKGRTKIGEKGIGRLAISLLGDQLLLLTKKKKDVNNINGKWILLYLHWSLFRNENLFLEEIEIPVIEFNDSRDLLHYLVNNFNDAKSSLLSNFSNKSLWTSAEYMKIINEIDNFEITKETLSKINHIEKKGGGTLFHINNIDNTWDWGSFNVNTEEDNLVRKKNRLKGILFSFQNFIDLFDKQLENDSSDKDIDTKEESNKTDCFVPKIHIDGVKIENKDGLNADDLRLFDYALKGEIRDSEFIGEAYIGGGDSPERVQVDKEKLTQGMILDNVDCGPIQIKWFFVEGTPTLSCIPQDQHQALAKKLDEIGGIYVFRDGLRILPYGEPDNDFLNVEKRRSLRAGTYLFSFRRMYGYIEIGKKTNPNLEDKSSREGFIENGYYNHFRTLLTNLLIWWAKDYLGTRSDSPDARRAQHILKSKQETGLQKKRDLEKKEEQNYFVRLDKWIVKFDETIYKNKQKCKRQIETFLKKKLTELHPVDVNELEKNLSMVKIGTNKLIESLDEMKWKMNYRYEHINEVVDIIENYNEIVDQLQKELEKDSGEIIKASLTKIKKQFISLDYINDKKKIIHQVDERINWLTESINQTIFDIEKERNRFLEDYSNRIQTNLTKIVSKEVNEIKDRIWSSNNMKVKILLEELVGFKMKLDVQDITNKDINTLNRIFDQFDETSLIVRELQAEYQNSLKKSDILNEFDKMLKNFVYSLENSETWNYDEHLIGKLKTELTTYRDLSALGLATELTDHEFNSIYAKINENFNKLIKALGKTGVLPILNNTVSAFKSLEKLHERMSPLYRQSRHRKKDIKIRDYVDGVLDFFSSDINRFEIIIKNDIPPELTVKEVEVVFFAPFVNMISNAIYWMLNQENRELCFYASTDFKHIYIHDTGPGIAEKDYGHIFEPFFSKKLEGRGLGLFLSKDILNSKGHELSLISRGSELRSLKGACFCVSFNNNSVLGV